MVQYVDWVNLMSYDLHGVWDSNNPIGNQVLAHTNLTEIDDALDLVRLHHTIVSYFDADFPFQFYTQDHLSWPRNVSVFHVRIACHSTDSQIVLACRR